MNNEINNRMNQEQDSQIKDLKTELENKAGIDISHYSELDKGNLTSRQNGYVGGYIGGTMVKQLVKMAQDELSDQ